MSVRRLALVASAMALVALGCDVDFNRMLVQKRCSAYDACPSPNGTRGMRAPMAVAPALRFIDVGP